MTTANIIIRPENTADIPMTSKIVIQAFNRENELSLVNNMREATEYIPELSIVADRNNLVLGYALYSPAQIPTSSRNIVQAALLHPVAVDPAYQKQGAGERLVRHGMERSRAKGFSLIFSCAMPQFFAKLGFQPAQPFGLLPDFPIKPGHFMVLDLSGTQLGKIRGKLISPNPFQALQA